VKVKFLKPYGLAKIGEICENINKPVADLLISRGVVKEIKPKKKRKERKHELAGNNSTNN